MEQRLRRRLLQFVVPAAALPGVALAYGRGGTCNTSFCTFTAMLVLIGLVAYLLSSVAANVKINGLLKGVFGHAGVQAILGFALLLCGIATLAVAVSVLVDKV